MNRRHAIGSLRVCGPKRIILAPKLENRLSSRFLGRLDPLADLDLTVSLV